MRARTRMTAPFSRMAPRAVAAIVLVTCRGLGSPCANDYDCGMGLACAQTESGARVCMRRCRDIAGPCPDFADCTGVPSGREPVCYTGGSRRLGERCESDLECGVGTRCTASRERELRTCHQVCWGEGVGLPCPEGTICYGAQWCSNRDGAPAGCRPGVCVRRCTLDARDPCVPGQQCVDGLCMYDVRAADCDGDGFPDCPLGETCREGVCYPPEDSSS